jgi:hypothetical protein
VAAADGAEIGRAGEAVRRVSIDSGFGKITAFVTDGHLPWPYGREVTGYAVGSVAETLARAKDTGAAVVAGPVNANGRETAMLQFPGGAIAEIHAP